MLCSESLGRCATRFVPTAIVCALLWMIPGPQWTTYAQELQPEAEKSQAEKVAAEKAAAEKAAAEKKGQGKAEATALTQVVDAYREGKEFVR